MKKQLLMLVLTLLPMVASAAEVEINCNNIIYKIDTSTQIAEVVRNKNLKVSGDIVIQEAVIYNGISYPVKSIGTYAFYGCNDITSVVIPFGIESIGKYAFFECSGLTSLEIPNSVTSLGESSISRCTGLEYVVIPNSVTNVDYGVFGRCSGLKTVNLSHNLNYIGIAMFGSCTSLSTIEIPNSVTEIRQEAFTDCPSLKTIAIPNSVTKIGSMAFQSCSALETIYIGEGVVNMGGRAFNNCQSLTDVYYYATSLPETDVELFPESQITKITLHVPASAVNIFKSADPWKNFKEIKPIEEESSKPVDYTVVNYNVDKMSNGNPYSYRLNFGIIENDLIQTLGISQEQFEANYSFDCDARIFTQYYMDGGVIKACSSQEANHANDELGKIKIIFNAENDQDSFIQWEVRAGEMSNYISNLGGNAANLRRYIKFHKTGSIDGPDDVYVSLSPAGLDDVSYPQCAKPTIAFQNGEILFGCETEGVEYVYTCTTPASTPQSTGRKFTPSTQYTIRVYAKKNGYLDSEPVTQEIDVRGLKGDVNDDGEVDIADAVKIVNLVVGKIDALARPAKEVKDEKVPQ